MSPSRSVTGLLILSRNLINNPLAIVDFPEPERPVKKIVSPRLFKGGLEAFNSSATSLYENHSGISLPLSKISLNSVPDIVLYSSSFSISSIGLYVLFLVEKTKNLNEPYQYQLHHCCLLLGPVHHMAHKKGFQDYHSLDQHGLDL